MENCVDYNIIKQILNGDKDLFNQLIDKYYYEIFKFTYNQVNDVEKTKDVVQEIFMRIYKKLSKYNPKKASFRTWIYRIANNYCINYHRDHHKDQHLVLHGERISDSEDILNNLIKKEDVSYILDLMEKNLSQRNYKILILHFYSDLSQTDIGETMNLAPKTVRNIVSESIQKIRALVGGE